MQQHDFRPKGPSTIPEGEGPKEERAKEDRVRKMLYAMHRVDKKDLKASQKKRGVELTFNVREASLPTLRWCTNGHYMIY